eukprot:TRINITY_DN3528_c0_g1_i2.p1 TRINITY_DN3528_c0_g1~~TRINITY_DN3528_c0_g1_i2.p1  ORF type:complete len:243 (+),score=55.42 TRINITY_DN3528_c0_g1_i2:43-771(+)
MIAGREFGSLTGGGAPASAEMTNLARKERMRQIALEKIDLNKDPYFMRNHLGSYECRLCLTLHRDEGSYLAHTQGKRHQENLARRAAKEAIERGISQTDGLAPATHTSSSSSAKPFRRSVKIGKPGYRVSRQVDSETGQVSFIFDIHYPDIDPNVIPRYRFMSAFEQKIEVPDRNYQYLIFAADPYDNIAFKIPSAEVIRDVSEDARGRMIVKWEPERKSYYFQVTFKDVPTPKTSQPAPPK